MEDWVYRALARWPNVPALYDWLSLDRRGRWLIRGEPITRPQIIDTINRNYAVDERGCWYFQNGPQRGYMKLEVAPFVLRVADDGEQLLTHNELPVLRASRGFIDAEGSLLLATEHGAAAFADTELDWALQRISGAGSLLQDEELAAALALRSGTQTPLQLRLENRCLPLIRLDAEDVEAELGFVRVPSAPA
ncbi:DUF2946 family protein [Solimonas terrae]|uniref:DUF2946 family protein n=1 Tax=Solimonas terrae TaxID=1396819 RepID=A0A6M2BR64_9GAMM|nr:DUF2946 family protein [Solimonas terrae]